MNKSFLTVSFLVQLVTFNAISADGIRLFQESDRPSLNTMLQNNPDLLLPGNSLKKEVASNARFFGNKNYTTQVFVKKDEIAGFITYQKAMPHWLAKLVVGALGSIQLLGVHENYRKQGIAHTLVTHALEDMTKIGFDTVMLQAKVANPVARHVYEKNGFKLTHPVQWGDTDCTYIRKLIHPKL